MPLNLRDDIIMLLRYYNELAVFDVCTFGDNSVNMMDFYKMPIAIQRNKLYISNITTRQASVRLCEKFTLLTELIILPRHR